MSQQDQTTPSLLAQRYPKALVTGVTSGLGAAFCDMLLEAGVEVWGTSRDATRVPQRDGLHAVALDLADGASFSHFMKAMAPVFPELHLVVNNAGNGIYNRFDCLTPDDIGEQLRVLLHGPIAICHAVATPMLVRGHGAVVNVASLAREFPLPYFSLYNAAKAGLSNVTRSLQTEWADAGVIAIDFQPGDYQTRFNDDAARPESMELDPRLEKAWLELEAHLAQAPKPHQAAEDLKRALLRGRSGTVRSGTFFQATLAPFLARFGSWRLIERCLRRYYGL